jgi:hypothetical protein
MRGISINKPNGIGDLVQFSSLPENYFKTFREKLVDVSRAWVFDHNPYVVRDVEPDECRELWLNHHSFVRKGAFTGSASAPAVFQSNAEHHASLMGAQVYLNRPRLYQFEDYPIAERDMVLLHTHGRSHGAMPEHVIEHVLKKYGKMNLLHVGLPGDPDLGIPALLTPSVWELARVISQARIFIGVDSGPSWIAACYPDVIVKKLRTRPELEYFKDWVPLEMANIHSHWDDRAFQIFNVSEDDVGFTQSYRRI